MKRSLSLVMLMLLVLSADAARAQSADGIKGVDDAWVAAARKGDVEAIVALYAPDAV
jgi:ketosteroid isomerase-like protein